MLFLQWFTDSFDGALGKFRDTGIPKWGFYMDHFLDYVFMSAILIGYSFLLEGTNKQIIYFLIPVFGCYMVSPYLAFGATNEFKITYLWTGPTEMRIWFAVLNCFLIWFGTGWIEKVLLIVFIGSIVFLCVVIFRTQKYIWKIDMQDKAGNSQVKPTIGLVGRVDPVHLRHTIHKIECVIDLGRSWQIHAAHNHQAY